MAEKPKQPPSAPVILSVNCLVDGKFFTAGSEVPFTAETLPEHLRAFIATGEEPPFYSHQERLIYDTRKRGMTPAWFSRPPAASNGCKGRRARRSQFHRNKFGPRHKRKPMGSCQRKRKRPWRTRTPSTAPWRWRQLAAHQRFTDAVYEDAERQVEEKQTQFYVKRGGAWGKVQNATLKPGEVCFVKRPNGQYEVSGYIDSDGQPPDPEITT